MKFLLSLTCLFLLSVPAYADFPVEASGADPSASASVNTAAMQTALDVAGATGGGVVTVTKAGTYLLAVQGTHPYYPGRKYCLDFKYDNVEFRLGSGVILKLANGQQVNGAPVDMLIFQGRKNLTFSGAGSGASIITGNAAGQTGWSLGYAQISNGIIISSFGVNGGAANSNITIKHLTLRDHFSNPINLDTFPSSQRNTNVRIEDVRSVDCGEGIQVGAADGVWIDDCISESPNHVAVGDAIELSNCTRFFLKNNLAKNHWSGSGFDIFGSTDGVIDGWISDDNVSGMDVHAFGGLPSPKNVTVSHGLIINSRGVTGTGVCTGIGLSSPSLNNIRVENVTMKGTPFFYGFQIGAEGQLAATGPVFIEDCVVDGGADGILIAAAISDLTIKGGSYSNMDNRGIVYAFQGNGITAAQVKNLNISGVRAINNGSYGILVDNQGYTVPVITGSISGCSLEDNGVNGLQAYGPETVGITAVNNLPNTLTAFPGGPGSPIFGYRFYSPVSWHLATFRFPSKNQEVVVRFTQAWNVIDRRQANGVNIDLAGGVNFIGQIGDTLTLRYENESSKWFEVSRSVNH